MMNSVTVPDAVDCTWLQIHDIVHRACYSRSADDLRQCLSDGTDISKLASDHLARERTVLHIAASGNAPGEEGQEAKRTDH